MREKMIQDAKNKRDEEKVKAKNEEKAQVEKLQADIEREKNNKAQKKVQERAAAMKVIQDNQLEKAKRVADAANLKRKDAEEIENYIKHQLEVEKRREEAIAQRGARIQKVMDSMAEVVNNKDKEMQMKQDREYIEACIAKDDQAQLQDIEKKRAVRQKHESVKTILAQQVREKQLKKEAEDSSNKAFMNQWTTAIEKDDKNRHALEQGRKQRLIANSEYLRHQMGAMNPVPDSSSAKKRADDIHTKKKYQLGGVMNPEEARMNRELLKEIARVKRGESPSSKLYQQADAPF